MGPHSLAHQQHVPPFIPKPHQHFPVYLVQHKGNHRWMTFDEIVAAYHEGAGMARVSIQGFRLDALHGTPMQMVGELNYHNDDEALYQIHMGPANERQKLLARIDEALAALTDTSSFSLASVYGTVVITHDSVGKIPTH